jgi:hypothetical protein
LYNRRCTPGKIKKLARNEIFVFGSNLDGMHGGIAFLYSISMIQEEFRFYKPCKPLRPYVRYY